MSAKMKRVQIVELRTETGGDGKPAKRWRFVAHGAAYDKPEAEDFAARYLKPQGRKWRFLPIP